MSDLPDYEKLGSFYLGKKYELAGRELLDEKVLYDAKDLTTHAMCVGMTGSGKTGLCLSLLEEAAIDGIPAICIDPKGDLGNLLLAFPEFKSSDYRPWIEESEASRKGMSPDEYAAETAEKWKAGLESWEQDAERVRRYRDAVDISIYTPGSTAGIPLTVLKSFDAPPAEVMDDAEVMRERVAGAASGLLTLMGVEADPLSSREHILLANIFDHAWRKGQNLDLPSLIRFIQTPPIEKVGVFDLETFFPAGDRLKLAMTLNNLLASPNFAGWLDGEPLDIKRLLIAEDGKPKVSIISIAHLSDSERMFFVTILLNELLGWMRTQQGTSSLRALFYMDEVYGYFPPTAKPPSKPPMLVLLKQARAFGLGIALATQNPVDLDYKGLSNIGTWFIGRLQTARDKERVLEGLEGAAAQAGSTFDRGAMEQTLAALGNRVFLMNNVHDDRPTIFQTRWAMSYLRGPLSRQQIQDLMQAKKEQRTPASQPNSSSSSIDKEPASKAADRPVIPNDIDEHFCVASRPPAESSNLLYRPALLAQASCHYVRVSAKLDDWIDHTLLYSPGKTIANDVWKESKLVNGQLLELVSKPEEGYQFAELPSEFINSKQYKSWEKDLKDHLYRRVPVRLFHCEELDATSAVGHDELDARLAWKQELRELRDEKKDELKEKYGKKLKSLESKMLKAQQRLEREQAQYDQAKWSSVLNFGQTVLGAFLGNRVSSKTATTGRSIGRAAQQRKDVTHAEETLEALEEEKRQLELEFETEVSDLQDELTVEGLTLEPVEYPCRKGDLKVQLLSLCWLPWEVDSDGIASPLFETTEIK